jgi:hypothetical protein
LIFLDFYVYDLTQYQPKEKFMPNINPINELQFFRGLKPTRMQICLPQDLITALQDRSIGLDTNTSELIRVTLEFFLKKKGVSLCKPLKTKNVPLQLCLPIWLKEDTQACAKTHNMGVSEFVQSVMSLYLANTPEQTAINFEAERQARLEKRAKRSKQ